MAEDAHLGRRRLWRFIATGASFALVGGAIALSMRQLDWASLAQLPWWTWAVLTVLVLTNVLLTGLMFWAVTLSFDAKPRVGVMRMTQLIAASALLNYLPLRAGLFGRAAVLKLHHALPLRQSMLILLVVLGAGCATTAVMGLLALLVAPLQWMLGASAVLLIAMTLLTPSLAKLLLRRQAVMAQLWIPLRVADTLTAAARLWVVYWAMGYPLTLQQSIVVGAAGLLITMVSFTPNGLGMREWVIALITHSLGAASLEVGLAATLIDRGVEVLVIAITGGSASVFMQKWMWKHPPATTDDSSETPA